MEWKMEWNSEPTELQLTRVTGTAQSRLNYLQGLLAISPQEVYEIAHHHASISKHGTVASSSSGGFLL